MLTIQKKSYHSTSPSSNLLPSSPLPHLTTAPPFPHPHATCHPSSPLNPQPIKTNATSPPPPPPLPKDPKCKLIRQTIIFPTYWDGKNLDSPDHKSQVAYGQGSGANGGGACSEQSPDETALRTSGTPSLVPFQIPHYQTTYANNLPKWTRRSQRLRLRLGRQVPAKKQWTAIATSTRRVPKPVSQCSNPRSTMRARRPSKRPRKSMAVSFLRAPKSPPPPIFQCAPY